jgi:acetoin utilization protein AcuB
MLAKDLVSQIVSPLKTSDTGAKALKWMSEFGVRHLPIVNEKQFLGLISEDDILDLSESEEALGNHRLSLWKPFVYEDLHIYDVIRNMVDMKLTLIPVIDREENYTGIILLEDLLQFFATFNSIQENGGVLVLEVNVRDYSLTEISRIAESGDAIILSSNVRSFPDKSNLEVIIKTNKEDLKPVIAAFERFEYKVKAYYHHSEDTEDMKNRVDSFFNYLNV